MHLTFESLNNFLPAGSIEFVGNNQLKINMNQVSGEQLTLQSSILEPIAKLLSGLVVLTKVVNDEQIVLYPTGQGIQFVSQSFDGSPEHPELVFEFRCAIAPQSFIENLLDPTIIAPLDVPVAN
jgi:hypothetical protein